MTPPVPTGGERFSKIKLALTALSLVVACSAFVLALIPSLGDPIRRHFTPPTCDDPRSLHKTDVPGAATATSTLADQSDDSGHTFSYLPEKAFDGNAATAWIPADRQGGAGQTLSITWAHPISIGLVCLVNGYASDEGTFVHNGTVSNVDVTTDQGKTSGGFRALDGYSQAGVTMPVATGETTTLAITITGARSALEQGADQFRDTAISEVTVYTA